MVKLLNQQVAQVTPKPENGIENTSFVRESPSRMSKASLPQTLRTSTHASARASGRSSAIPKPRSSPPEKQAKMEIDENLNRHFCWKEKSAILARFLPCFQQKISTTNNSKHITVFTEADIEMISIAAQKSEVQLKIDDWNIWLFDWLDPDFSSFL